MIPINEMHKYLQQNLSHKRYIHSKNTADIAEKLAGIYGQDKEKAYLAGLLHDCTKEIDMNKQHMMLKALNYQVDEITFNTRELLHAYTAEYILKNTFIIEDKDIIMAIRSHTTGKKEMTELDKIIFLSDVIEPSRSYTGIEYLRKLAVENLDQAVLYAFNSSILFLINKNSIIHPDILFARNDVIGHLHKKEMRF